MFRNQGGARSDRQNRVVAGYLALVGGYVNAAGFVLVGAFTSHATGNVGRFAHDVATAQTDGALAALAMIAAFVVGAFVASMCIESSVFGQTPKAYGAALAGEAMLLATFTAIATATAAAHPRVKEMEAALLCAAMGMQNSLVTRLSGAVVRTTHLTGVFTDIGIEGARWFRWGRGRLSRAVRVKLAFGANPPERPATAKIALLGTIATAFTVGALGGAFAAGWWRHAAMIGPIAAIAVAAIYAFATSGRERDSVVPGPETRR